MGNWQHELKFAARQLRRTPGFTATVLLTLAVAIGANTAMFSLVNALMLKSLPYPHSEALGTIYAHVTGAKSSDFVIDIDGEHWDLLRDGVPALMSAVSAGTSGVNLRAGSQVAYVHDGRVSARYLDVLGQQPIIGRNFSQEEDRPHGPKTAILSDGVWRNIFGANPRVLGQIIELRSEPYTVIGVLPQGAVTPLNADVYTPLQPNREAEGAGANFDVITRLRNGASWEQANAQINRAWAALAHDFEKHSPGSHIAYYSVPLQKGETAALRPQVTALMAVAVLILLVACANLAGLALLRVLRRSPEVATRLALGASPWQIQTQFWAENLLLALLGGAVGIGVGFAGLRGLLLTLPPHFLPVEDVSLDARVMGVTLIAALLTSVLFGMLPALAIRKVDIRSSMSTHSLAAARNPQVRQALIVGEVAITVMLVAASGLLIRTLIHLETLPRGFNPDGVMIAKASLDDARFRESAAFRKLLDESTAAMQQIPGVRNAAVGLSVPYERAVNLPVMLGDGKEAGQMVGADVTYVTPGYFDTLGMSLLAGRVFTAADGADSQAVAIVNQSFARKFYGGGNPVGHYLDKTTLIVGEVADVPVPPGLNPAGPLASEQALYVPAAQFKPQYLSLVHMFLQPDWIVRTAAPVQGLTADMQRALSSADPNLPASGFYRMDDLLAETLTTQRIEVVVLGAMAALALLLSAVGVFALVANLVAQRAREIGIRMALGSTVGHAMIEMGRAGATASMVGVLAGLLLCVAALPVIRSWLYGVGVYDATTLAGVVMLVLVVTLTATLLPTLRIARLDPAKSLREE
ncbi:MAG: ADOP family duplicated permease [Betaproteobacteria bacterium]